MIATSEFEIRTYHCDSFGHVNNARHLELLEEARWRFSEEIGLTPMLREHNVGFIIIDMRLRFRAPVFEGQTIRIETSLVTLGSASGEVKQTMFLQGEKSPAIKSMFHFILIDREKNNRSISIDGPIRECLESILEPE
jgi:thioesterase-3